LQQALNAGVPAGWLTGDEIYGQDKRLRVRCEQHGLPYVLATRSNDTVATVDWRQRRVRALIAELPPSAWQRCSCGRAGELFAAHRCHALSGRSGRPPWVRTAGRGPR
jgi:SRSO17 transposase